MLSLEKDSKDGCCLKKMMTVSLSSTPTCMATTTSCIAIATADRQVYTYRLPTEKKITQVLDVDICQLATNQPEDSHTDRITSLSVHQTLNLIATSSNDGRIKVWDSSCDLVAEVVMGSAVDAICFVTMGADLLIGFQHQLCVILGKQILSTKLLEELHEEPNVPERSLSFNPLLQFW